MAERATHQADETSVTPADLDLVQDPSDDDAEKLWEEIRREQRAAKDDDGAEAPSIIQPPTSAAIEDPLEEPAAEPESGADPERQAADPEEPPADEEPSKTEAETEVQPEDPWADVPEPLRAEIQKLRDEHARAQQAARSNAGRIAAYQRQIEELKRAPQSTPAAEAGDPEEKPDGMSDAEWAKLHEEYPELAAPIGGRMKKLEDTIAEMRKLVHDQQRQLGGIQEERTEQETRRAIDAISTAHPDWQDIVRTDDYQSWLSGQPPAVQALHESWNPEDAISLLQFYKLASAGHAGGTNGTGAAPEASPPRRSGGATPQAKPALPPRRERQLQSAASVPSRSTPQRASGLGVPEDGDEEALWQQIRAAQRAGKMR